MKRRALLSSAAAIAGAGIAPQVFAQGAPYPSKPIRIIVAWPPGSLIDVITRIISEPMREILKQPLIIENKAGATGAIGA